MKEFSQFNFLKLLRANVFVLSLGWVCYFSLACVSIKLATPEIEKSGEAVYRRPGKPFESFSSNYLDQAWKNSKNGNTISFLSECNNPTDPSLESMHRGIISEVENVQIIEKSQTEFNSRSSIHSILQGSIDGVPNRMQFLIFKKNSCTYVLTYTALVNNFGENQRDFHLFAKGFKVP